jgi:trans-aconitate 2-methyltransferase
MPWNPEQYHKFQSERSAPFYDLIALVEVRPGLKVVDLGCGTGELTRELAGRRPASRVTGLDSSPQMLEKAVSFQRLAPSTSSSTGSERRLRSSLTFEPGDQASLTGGWDLIFSNAALHWSGNHAELIPYLFSRLNPGGQIAVQMPSNHNHISHQIYRETAGEEPFKTILQGFQRSAPVLTIDQYAQILYSCGAEEITVFEKVYAHVLEDADAVVDWISGTALIPYFERLGDHKDSFVESIRTKMHAAIPNGPVFYPFRRILFSARKAR